jgi:hypothetical protein
MKLPLYQPTNTPFLSASTSVIFPATAASRTLLANAWKPPSLATKSAALSVLSVLSFGAFAADSINAEQAQSREAIGTVSVGAIGTSPMDMKQMLNKKAEEQGASSYRVIEARSGDHWHATAELYK